MPTLQELISGYNYKAPTVDEFLSTPIDWSLKTAPVSSYGKTTTLKPYIRQEGKDEVYDKATGKHITAEQAAKIPNFWDGVEVVKQLPFTPRAELPTELPKAQPQVAQPVEQPKSIIEKIKSIVPSEPFTKLAEFFKPKEQEKEVVAPDIIGFAKTVGQSIARSVVAIGTAKEKLARGEVTREDLFETGTTPQTELSKKILGTDQEISFESIGREVASITGKEISSEIAVPLGIVFAGLDVMPFFSGKVKTASKAIAKLNKADDIIPVLKGLVKGGDDEIKALAQGLEQVSDPKTIEKLITKVKTTPVVKTQPLTQEVRKYNSAEEFVNTGVKGKYKTINEGGILKEVSGKPIKLVKGIETFIHAGDHPKRFIKGFIISEKSSGRYIIAGETEREAIANAKKLINSIGEKKFKQQIAKFQLTDIYTQATKQADTGLEALKVEARKYKTADEFGVANHIAGTTIGKGMSKEVFVGHATREGIGSINLKGITNESPAKFYDNWSGYLKTLKEGKYDIGYDDFYTQATKGVETPLAKIIKPKTAERSFITRAKEKFPIIEDLLEGQYVPRSRDKLAREAQELIKTDLPKAELIAATKTTDEAIAIATELIKKHNTTLEKSTSRLVQNVHADAAAKIANKTAENLTEHGRAIEAAKILGQLTPEGQIRFAAKTIQKYNQGVKEAARIPELTGKQAKSILDQMNDIRKMPNGEGKAMSFKKVQNEIQDLVPTPLFKKIINIWKAGLLTGIKTTGLNTFSNLWHGVSEVVKDVPAAIVDSVASLFTGKRTLGLTVKGTGKGVKEGFSKGWRYLKTGFDERNIAPKLDWQRVNYGDSKFAKGLQKYEQSVFRLMGAEDQPFYYGAKARSMASQAIAQGKNSGLKGKALTKYVNDLVKSPTDEILHYAQMDAEIAVFQNKTGLGTVAKGLQDIGKGAGQIVVPFGRTPAAVATQMFNYTPAGAVAAIIKSIGKGKFDQRMFSQAMGRGITGTGALVIGGTLFTVGLMALEYPKTEKEQKQWQLEGKKPNSIKVGNKWRSVAPLGPAGMVLLIGGHFQNGLNETGSIWKGITQAMAGGVKSLTEQTFLQGLNQAVGALNDPKRLEGYFKRTVGSVVPTIVSDVARAKDPSERRTEGFFDALISRVPGARETLEPQIDILGQELERGGNFLETMIDPTRPVETKSSPVIDELKRLWDLGYRVTPTQLGDKAGYKVLTPEKNTRLWQKTGQLLESKLEGLFATETYKEKSDEEKAKKIDEFVTKANLYGRVETVMQEVAGLEGQARLDKLSELKEGELLTRTVFDKYNQLR